NHRERPAIFADERSANSASVETVVGAPIAVDSLFVGISIDSFQSKPLKAFRWITVHGHHLNMVKRKSVKVPRQRLDPARIVMPNSNSFRQIKHAVCTVL